MFYDFPYIGNFIIPTDFHIFGGVEPPTRFVLSTKVRCGPGIGGRAGEMVPTILELLQQARKKENCVPWRRDVNALSMAS